jgi:hypothetical protein
MSSHSKKPTGKQNICPTLTRSTRHNKGSAKSTPATKISKAEPTRTLPDRAGRFRNVPEGAKPQQQRKPAEVKAKLEAKAAVEKRIAELELEHLQLLAQMEAREETEMAEEEALAIKSIEVDAIMEDESKEYADNMSVDDNSQCTESDSEDRENCSAESDDVKEMCAKAPVSIPIRRI